MQAFPEVLAAARLGQAWAFRALWDAYAAKVHGYLRSKGVADAEDQASEVFAAAFTSLERFAGDEAAFRAWLFTIAHRRAVDAHRRAARAPEPLPYEADADTRLSASAEDDALDALGTQRVRALLDRISDDQREVLLLRLVGDLTVEQVAEAVGKRVGAVKALQRRGLAAVARILEQEAVETR